MELVLEPVFLEEELELFFLEPVFFKLVVFAGVLLFLDLAGLFFLDLAGVLTFPAVSSLIGLLKNTSIDPWSACLGFWPDLGDFPCACGLLLADLLAFLLTGEGLFSATGVAGVFLFLLLGGVAATVAFFALFLGGS